MKEVNQNKVLGKSSLLLWLMLSVVLFIGINSAQAREVNYNGSEITVFVKPGEPTQISFPGAVEGGFKGKQAPISLEKQDNYLVVFAQPNISIEGEAIIVHLNDKRTYSVRLKPAVDGQRRDGFVEIVDQRPPPIEITTTNRETETSGGRARRKAPPTAVSGLMRELMLRAEFGKKKNIPGYRPSNKFTGEVVLQDGTMEVKIEEILMGSNLWGYVLTARNLLNTTQKINPATFRLDGTRAVSAQRWELAPLPLTAEQRISNAHIARIYVVTRAQRR